jgi:hypothetical protein
MVTEPPISEITSKNGLHKHPNGIIPRYFSQPTLSVFLLKWKCSKNQRKSAAP